MALLASLFRAQPVATPVPTLTGGVEGLSLWQPNENSVTVTPYSSLQLSTVYACIRLLSETLAQLPLSVRRHTADGSELAHGHPLYNLLHNTPNPWMTSFTWLATAMVHLCGWGNSYSLIVRDQLGRPGAIVPLLPEVTYPTVVNNRLRYWTTFNGVGLEVPKEDMIHVLGVSHDGLTGLSPIALHREAIGLGLAQQSFGAKLFASGSMLSGILKHPGRLKRKPDKPDDPSPIERLRRQWRELYGGVENAGSVAVLEEGMEFQKIAVDPIDAQFIEGRKYQTADIARIFNVPSHLINDLDRATFNNISELSLSFLRYTMTPWIVRWEQEFNRKLFPKSDRYFAKFNLNGLLRGTLTERKDYYKTAIEYGWLSRNEVRALEDLNRVDGLDAYLQPLNMGSGQDDGDPDDLPTEGDSDEGNP